MQLRIIVTSLILSVTISACDGNGGSVENAAPGSPGYTAEELEQFGPFSVVSTDIAIVNTSGKGDTVISARAYLPDSNELHPLVIVLPGFGGTFEYLEPYSEHFASHGHVVVGVSFAGINFVNPDGEQDRLVIQVQDAIGHALTEYSDRIDASQIGLVGHSNGGKMAMYTAAVNNGSNPDFPIITLTASMDPVNSGGAPCFILPDYCALYPVAPNPDAGEIGNMDSIMSATLIFRSEIDLLATFEQQFNASFFFYGYDGQGLHGAPSPALYVDMGTATHGSYGEPYDEQENPTPRIAKRTITAWLKTHFLQAQNLDNFYTGEFMQQDIDAGLVVGVEAR